VRGTAEARCCQAECESCARTACAVVTSPDHGRSAAMRRPAPWLHQHGRSVDRAAVALKECIAVLAKALHVCSARPADLAAEA